MSESAGSLWSSRSVPCSRVSWQSKFESVQVGDPCSSQLAAVWDRVSWRSECEFGGNLCLAPESVVIMCLSPLAGRICVSLQPVSESTGRLCSSKLAVCGRVCWQSQLETVPVGGSCPSPFKLAVCVRVSWQSVSEVGSGLRSAFKSADSLCLRQLAGCVRVSMWSGSEPAGNQCPSQLTVSD